MDGIESKDSSFPDVGVAVFKVGTESGNERFEELDVFRDLLEEAEGSAADIFIWVLLEKVHISHPKTSSRKERTRSLRMALLKNAIEKTTLERKKRHAHNQNHLLLQLSVLIVLWTNFPIEVKQLLQLLVLRGHDVLDDGH